MATTGTTNIWDSQSSVADDTSLLRCNFILLGKWFPQFWRIEVMTSSSSTAYACLTKVPSTFKTQQTTHPATKQHVPEDLDP